jgi:hypothetical protein
MPVERNYKPILWGALLGLSLALRLPGLFESLWFDEVYRTFVVLREDGIKDLLLHDVHNPLYNACMYGWIRVFGDSEVSIRLPSLLAGYLLTWLIWRWTRPRLGERAAAIAAVWLLLSPVPVWYSAEAKNSIFTALTSSWVLITHSNLLAAGGRDAGRRLTLCILACILAVLTDFQTLLIILPVWAGVALEVIRRRPAEDPAGTPPLGPRLACIIAATIMTLLPLLIFKAVNFSELPRDYPGLFNIKSLLWFLCLWMPIGTVLPNAAPGWWPLEVASTGVILLPLLFLGLRRLRGTASGWILWLSFCFPLAFYLIASAVLHAMGDKTRIYQDRNLIVVMPWYPVILAAGIDSITRKFLRDLAAGVVLVGALASSLAIELFLQESWTVMTPNPDWRGAARIIDNTPGRALVLSRTALLPLRYYSHDSELIEFRVPGKPPDEAIPADEVAKILAARPEREFFLISDPWWAGLQPADMPALDAAFPLIERTTLRSLVVERRGRR